jgi:hypothetical protein
MQLFPDKHQTLILTGGLSASRYVQYRIDRFVEEELNGSVAVIKPARAWSAIARGAAISAAESKIVTYRRQVQVT